MVHMSNSSSKPSPPHPPESHECCGTGCIPCVMDIYEEARWEYEMALKKWQDAHPAATESDAQ